MAVIVEVERADKSGWDEISRYDPIAYYVSGRHTPPKSMTGEDMAKEDCMVFVQGYDRAARVRHV